MTCHGVICDTDMHMIEIKQALIFDFDGLILDTETPEVQLWQELFSRHGQEFPMDDWVRTVVGSSTASLDPRQHLASLSGASLPRITRQEKTARLRRRRQAPLPPLPGVREMLTLARQAGLRLAIASSSPHRWVDGTLSRLGFLSLFEAVVCREDAARVKPAPDLYLAALAALQVPPSRALAFEDSPNGITAARQAGLKVVGVPNNITSRLGPLDSDLTLESLAVTSLAAILAAFGDHLILREEQPEDLEAVCRVEKEAFKGEAEANLVDLVRQRGKASLSMVAVLDGVIVGHILFTPVTAAGGRDRKKGAGLGPVAVLPEFHGKGIGSRLIRAGLERMRQQGTPYVVLLGDPAYYYRFGFKAGRDCGLTSEYGDGKAFQVLELVPGGLRGIKGLVRYLPEFSETGC
jgi:putative hydrolase of the HAD superfamily